MVLIKASSSSKTGRIVDDSEATSAEGEKGKEKGSERRRRGMKEGSEEMNSLLAPPRPFIDL
jgi:hypothetical protein